MYTHRAPLRFSDTDLIGHVNHARFASLFEDARMGYLRTLAGDGFAIVSQGLILARLEIDYVRPLMLSDDPVETDVSVIRIGKSSFDLAYELRHHGEVAARGRTVLVTYDYAAARSRPLTDAERLRLQDELPMPDPA